jgi:hypothetical protein
MEKLLILGLAYLMGAFTLGEPNMEKPNIVRCKADKAIKKTDKPVFSHQHYYIKDYDPN